MARPLPFSGKLDSILNGRKPLESEYGRPIVYGEEGNALIGDTIRGEEPSLVARLGAVELSCITYSTRARWLRRVGVPYPRSVREGMRLNAGFFPATGPQLDRFSSEFLDAVSQTDVMAVWFNRNEHQIIRRYCPSAAVVGLGSLEAMLYREPWSAALAGKVVLVVHPFARSIESQYHNHRRQLFRNPAVLPEFELKTIRAVQSIAGNTGGFDSWFDALDEMRDRISAEQFDVAIVGAGAYGLPLAAFAKRMGKHAIHLGGVTQIFFGINGRRWETEYKDSLGKMINEYWVRPTAEETPERAETVEEGCYW